MRTSPRSKYRRSAFTLLEMTVVIMVLLALVKVGLFASSALDKYKLGRIACESLRSVYTAQRMYLADNPTASVTDLTSALLIPYMPNGATTIPTVKSLTGATLTVILTVSPPVINAGSGVTYDPSGSNLDSLWDVGE